MIIEFSTKNFDLSENLKNFTEKRMQKLQKFFQDEDWQAKILLRGSKHLFETEIAILHNGEWVKAKAKGNQMEHSIIQTVDHLKTQLAKKIKKLKEKKRWEAHHKKEMNIEKELSRIERKFLRRNLNQVDIETLSEEEAISKFDPQRKPFLLFKDISDDTLKIIYEEKERKIILNLGA